MKIAIEGCAHGELDAIYAQIKTLEAQHGYTVDVLLICGDFQAIRNHQDLQCMAVPQKYRQLGGFYKYYTGEVVAPILTIIIGGNHESSNYMWELYHGGWVAPNIYFLGHAGCVQVGYPNGKGETVRIAGASGIFKGGDFRLGHYETVPYDNGTMRSIYHIREYCVRKLSLLTSPQIFLSHDWPQGIEHHGNIGHLMSRKKFLVPDINSGRLGSPPLMGLLRTLQPQWWFSAHLHARYDAIVAHGELPPPEPAQAQELNAFMGTVEAQIAKNPDEITIDDEDEPAPPPPVAANPDEITIDDDEEDDETAAIKPSPAAPAVPVVVPVNPEEITIEDDDDGPKAAIVDPAPSTDHPAEAAADVSMGDETAEPTAEEEEAPEDMGLPMAFGSTHSRGPAKSKTRGRGKAAGRGGRGRGHAQPSNGGTARGTPQKAEGSIAPRPPQGGPNKATGFMIAEPTPVPVTRFLALDKCLPRRDFLEVIEIGEDLPVEAKEDSKARRPVMLSFDPEWLAITRAFHPLLSTTRHQKLFPDEEMARGMVQTELEWVNKNVTGDALKIDECQAFTMTAPGPGSEGNAKMMQPPWYTNPQTVAFCSLLSLENKINPPPKDWKPTPKPADDPVPTAVM